MRSLKLVIRETEKTSLNCSGIWAGMKTVRYFDGKTYNWVGASQQKSFYDKVCNPCHFYLSI
jgi:hypothetical protein